MIFKVNSKKAFTLAEVLITLTVIGIVASLSIPTLMNNINDAQNKAAWKKAYAEFAQATLNSTKDSGENLSSYLDNYGDDFCYSLPNKYFPYLKKGNLFTNTTTPVFDYKSLNKNNITYGLFDDGQYILNNGAFVACNCNNCNGISGHIIWLDVNGYAKGPNIIGKDIFGMKLYPNSVKPIGSDGDGYEETCNITSGIYSGWGCSAKYIYE